MLTCKLCLKICQDDFEELEDTTQEILNFLMINWDLSTNQDSVVCSGCKDDLKTCFAFKKKYLDKRNGILMEQKDVLPPAATMNEYVKDVDISVDKNDVCYFCMEYSTSSISLMDEVNAVEVLQKYCPELDLNITESPLICKPCYKSLQKYEAIMSRYLTVKAEVKESCDIESITSADQTEVKNVQHFVLKEELLNDVPVLLNSFKMEASGIYENTEIQNEALIKTEYYVKSEEIDVKTEDDDDDSNEEDPASEKLLEKSNYGCEVRPYQTTHKSHLQTNKCEICQFQTKCERSFKLHTLTHQSAADVTMHQCDTCEYRSDIQHNFWTHKQTHTDTTPVITYKCEICQFQTKYKKSLQLHALTHKSASEVTMYDCDMCEYRSRFRRSVTKHKQKHTVSAKVTIYKCETCEFQTKYKKYLKLHGLMHKSASEVTMYNCDMCEYRSRFRTSLARHKQKHTGTVSLRIYKCQLCHFQTKHRASLNQHALTHKNASDVKMYECDVCGYRTKLKRNLPRHKQTHKSDTEVTMYKCELCEYQTRRKDGLRPHMLTHKNNGKLDVKVGDVLVPNEIQQQDIPHILTHKHTLNLTACDETASQRSILEPLSST